MNLLIAILLCLNWVSVDSLKSIVKREKATEFYIDKDGNIRVNAIKNKRLYHYIISPQGKIEKIKGPKIPEGTSLLYNHWFYDPVHDKPFVQTSTLRNDIILLTKKGRPLTDGFLPTRQDFPLYEYKVDEKNKKITYQRTIMLPGKAIYEMDMDGRYLPFIGGGGPLRAQLAGLGKDYAILLVAGYDKGCIPKQPEAGGMSVEYMLLVPDPAAYYLILFKLTKKGKNEFGAEIYKRIPITYLRTRHAFYIEGYDKNNNNLYYITFTSDPNFIVKVHLGDKLKDLNIEKFPVERYKDMLLADKSTLDAMSKYLSHFVSYCYVGANGQYHSYGMLNVSNDTLTFYFPLPMSFTKAYTGRAVVNNGKLKDIKGISHVNPVELSYKDLEKYKNNIEFNFVNPYEFLEEMLVPKSPRPEWKKVYDTYLYIYYLSPDGTFYHKKFKLLHFKYKWNEEILRHIRHRKRKR